MPNPAIDIQLNPHKIAFFKKVNQFIIPTMQVFVKDDKNTTRTIEIRVDARALELMEILAKKTNIAPFEQILWFAGKQLEAHHYLEFYDIKDESTIHLTGPVDGGANEYPVMKAFLKMQIVHGNVTGLLTRDSLIALHYLRSEDEKIVKAYNLVFKQLRFAAGYENKKLQKMCFNAMITEEFHGGNCKEMAEWTAAKMIQTTENQWIYVCYFDGTFTLKDDIDINDTNHVLYDEEDQKVSNEFDHVMVITYPTEVDSVENMTATDAKVMDTWYDNLVCSLEDYKATLHPYYDYEYAAAKISLESSNIRIMKHFEAIGTPFYRKKEVAESGVRHMKKILYARSKNVDFDLPASKYNFAIQPRVRDYRRIKPLESLEDSLLEAQKNNQHAQEVDSFQGSNLITLFSTTNDEVLTALFEAADGVRETTFGEIARLLKGASIDKVNQFCQTATTQTIEKFFATQFELNAALLNVLDDWLANDNPNTVTILTSLTSDQLHYYGTQDLGRFQLILGRGTTVVAIKSKIKQLNWPAAILEPILRNATTDEVINIVDNLRTISKVKAGVAIEQLTPNQFTDYLENHLEAKGDLTDFCQSGGNDPVLEGIFKQFKDMGIVFDPDNSILPAADPALRYHQGLTPYFRGAYIAYYNQN